MKVRSLIEDIRDVRFHKVETDLEGFNGFTIAVKVNFPNVFYGTMVCESVECSSDVKFVYIVKDLIFIYSQHVILSLLCISFSVAFNISY